MRLFSFYKLALQCIASIFGVSLLFFLLPASLLSLAVPQAEPFIPLWQNIVFLILFLCICSGGYLLVGLVGNKIITSKKLRILAALLLIAETLMVLLFTYVSQRLFIGMSVLAFTLLLFGTFIWPTKGIITLTHHSSGTPNGAP